jgi:methionyl-tRNA formyltransferase
MTKVALLSMFSESIVNELDPRYQTDLVVVQDLETFDLHSFYDQHRFELLVCFGYSKRLPVGEQHFKNARFVNVHTSLLPFGRGSNPNLCNWLCGEPHGITIHTMVSAFDAGPTLFQKRLELDADRETLRSSYFLKIATAVDFLVEKWADLLASDYVPLPQDLHDGSVLTRKELSQYSDFLQKYNDRPISEMLVAFRAAGLPMPSRCVR